MPETDNTAGDLPKEESRATSEQARAAKRVPLTDEQILAAHIGELAPLVGPLHEGYQAQPCSDRRRTQLVAGRVRAHLPRRTLPCRRPWRLPASGWDGLELPGVGLGL